MDLYFDDLSMDELVGDAMSCTESGEKCVVITPNAEIALLCKKDPELKRIINESRLVLPDGISVVLASKILGKEVKHKAAGIEFAQALCREMAKQGKRLFLFGAKPGIAEKAGERLKSEYPGLVIAGTRNGYFKPEEEAFIIEEINKSQSDALFVCLGAPKQEHFMDKYKNELNVPVMAGLGGSVDVMAGEVRRAPKVFIKLGLEWFYRLVSDPKRIKRMIKLPLYLWDAFKWKIGGRDK